MNKVTSLRGPYDLFSADRNKPISDGHFAAPVSTFVYSPKSLTLCHCIQYEVPYTMSLYTISTSSSLHCVIVYSTKSLTLCHCRQYQVPYTVIVYNIKSPTLSLYTILNPLHYVIVYNIKSLTLFHCIQYQVPYDVLLYTILSPLHCHCVQYQVPYTMTLHTVLYNVKPRTLKCALRMMQDFCSPLRNWLSWGLASMTWSLRWMSGAESTSSARASLAPWPSIPARPQSASTTAVWRSAPGNRSVRVPYPFHPNLSVVGDVVPVAQSAFLQLNTFIGGIIWIVPPSSKSFCCWQWCRWNSRHNLNFCA